MIVLTTQTADENGMLQIDESVDSSFGSWPARASRTKTLDGGVWINHSGVVDGDRTFTIKATLTEDQAESLDYFYRNYQLINLSCSEGLFSGALSTKEVDNGELTMKFLVKEKL